MSDEEDDKPDNVIAFNGEAPDKRVYEMTLINNSRRYRTESCPHKGPFTVDRKLGTVECGDCGALLNPIYVLEVLAAKETYWNLRRRDLEKYLGEINAELEQRTRTKCTHCGNMTAIRFKNEKPKTWVPEPY